MKSVLLAGAALALAAVPAHAQLLGGVGGSVGGAVGGAIGTAGSLDVPVTTVHNATRGTLENATRAEGSQSVDRKKGRVKADRKAEARGSGSAAQANTTPLGGLTGAASGSARGSGSANADAQLVGTDAVGSAVGQATATARGVARSTVQQAHGTAHGLVNSAGNAAANAQGSAAAMASGTASGALSGAAGQLALAGSAAAAGSGMASVAPGMRVIDSSGDSIGRVREIVASSRGDVHELLISTDKGDALLPASNFAADGNLLVSAMGEGRLEKTAKKQARQRDSSQSVERRQPQHSDREEP